MRKELGKIKSVRFGYGGYGDSQFGLSLTLASGCSCVNTGHQEWGLDISSRGTEWDEAARDENFALIMRKTNQLMIDAKVKEVHELVGIPIEIEWDGNSLKDWRILTEVL